MKAELLGWTPLIGGSSRQISSLTRKMLFTSRCNLRIKEPEGVLTDARVGKRLVTTIRVMSRSLS